MCKDAGVQIPKSYISRRTIFYETVKKNIGPLDTFVRSLSGKLPTFLYPSDRSDNFIANSISKNCTFENPDISSESADVELTIENQNPELLELIHTALKIKMVSENTPDHSSAHRGIDLV